MPFNPMKLRVWHEQLMDALILHPRASHEELAAMFNTSKQYVCNITTSDLFKLQLEQRRDERARMVDKSVVERLQGKLGVLAEAAVERLTDAVMDPQAPVEGVRDTCDMALRAIGFGAPAARSAPIVQNTVVVLDREMLAEARAKMRGAPPILDALSAPNAA